MAERMKEAWKGQGDGLQGASTAVGNMMAEETQSRGQKRADEAGRSLSEMANGGEKSGPTVGGTAVDASEQIANQEAGTADHVGLREK